MSSPGSALQCLQFDPLAGFLKLCASRGLQIIVVDFPGRSPLSYRYLSYHGRCDRRELVIRGRARICGGRVRKRMISVIVRVR